MKMPRAHSIVSMLLALSLFGAAPSAFAEPTPQEKADAAALYKQGVTLMEKGDFPAACPKFVESQRLDPALNTQIALAKCYDAGGKTASAWSSYRDLAFEFKKAGNAAGEKAANDKKDELEKTLSRLQINATSDAPGLVIRRDNEEISKAILGTPVPVDPGKHTIEATAPGYQVWQTTVTIGKANDTQTVTIPGLVAAPKQSSSLRTIGYAVGGVGVAGVVVGGVFGGLAASAKGKLTTDCPNNVCSTQASQDELASAKTKALISTIGLAAGGALAATGVVLILVSPSTKKEEAPKAARFIPSVGPQGAGLTVLGTF
jgi:hypothetical protein